MQARRVPNAPERAAAIKAFGTRVVAFTLALAVAACAGKPALEVAPTPAEVCAAPGPWGVASSAETGAIVMPPAPMSNAKAAGEGALAGATASVMLGAGMAAKTMSGGAGSKDPITPALAAFFLAAGIVIAPVAAVIGAGIGAAKGTESDEVAAARANLESALRDARSADAVRAAMIEQAASVPLRTLLDCGDAATPEACDALPGDDSAANLIVVRADPPFFEVDGQIEPHLRLLLRAEASIYRSGETDPVYVRAWVFRGERASYLDLARGGAARFRQQLAAGEKAIAAKAVSDLLVGGVPEPHDTRQQPEGAVWTVVPPGVPQAAAGICPVPLAARLPFLMPSAA